MTSRCASDLLYESAAALRLVDGALHRACGMDPRDLVSQPPAPGAPASASAATDGRSAEDAAHMLDGLERALLQLGELDARSRDGETR
jgi:hypothetical protein